MTERTWVPFIDVDQAQPGRRMRSERCPPPSHATGRLDRNAGLGVCSACPGSVERWDAGDRDVDDLSLCS